MQLAAATGDRRSPRPPTQARRSLPPPVVVTAVNGNIFIRRGPDLAFNPISACCERANRGATARDVLARWLQIAVPGDPQRTGWITIVTSYTVVSGDVRRLPEVEPTVWPSSASSGIARIT